MTLPGHFHFAGLLTIVSEYIFSNPYFFKNIIAESQERIMFALKI
jgi:hypothetical protein